MTQYHEIIWIGEEEMQEVKAGRAGEITGARFIFVRRETA